MYAYLEYLPLYLREIKEYKAIGDCSMSACLSLERAIHQLYENRYIDSASLSIVVRWERMLKLYPKASDTLDNRRDRIRNALAERLPYTERALCEMLRSLCGGDNYTESIEPGYILRVRIKLAVKHLAKDVAALLERVVPQNLIIDFSVDYNTHGDLMRYLQSELAAFTHLQLRESPLPAYVTCGKLQGFTYRELAQYTIGELRYGQWKTVITWGQLSGKRCGDLVGKTYYDIRHGIF